MYVWRAVAVPDIDATHNEILLPVYQAHGVRDADAASGSERSR
jgi:hypothetical protein